MLSNLNNSMEKSENGNSSLHGEYHVQACKHCSEKIGNEYIKQNGKSSNAKLFISSTASLASTDSSISCYSDVSVDANLSGRVYQDHSSTESSQEDPSCSCFHRNEIHQYDTLLGHNNVEGHSLHSIDINDIGSGDSHQATDNDAKRLGLSIPEKSETSPYDNDTDMQFWLPPDAEDQEADREDSVVMYDEDDECSDGIKWSKQSSFSSFGEEGCEILRYTKEKQKTMDEVMSGRFKVLVSQLLKSVGVVSSFKTGGSWLDIVTSLSWQAASSLKPDSVDGNAMHPDGRVKVKCIATGSCSQSQFFKGLVFKKHAALKRMPTKCMNPRLLLIKGTLGLSSSGLSSFQTMEQEEDGVKSIIEKIDLCQPNLVLVEKTVSRAIQESILAKGMTLVCDMKLRRLERVARYTGSQILSSDSLHGQNIKQCDSFHFEKFEEELAAFCEGEKRPSKTLLFLEGCNTHQGCTILLKGAHGEELKKIKCVVRCAIVMAYHLILETSFLLDQRAMFSTIPSTVVNLAQSDKQFHSFGSGNANDSCHQQPKIETGSFNAISIPISNGFHEEVLPYRNLGFEDDYSLAYGPYYPANVSLFSNLSVSLKKVFVDGFPTLSSSCQPLTADQGFIGVCSNDKIQIVSLASSPSDTIDHDDVETEGSTTIEISLDEDILGSSNQHEMLGTDDICTVLDSESILVLMSSRNASRGTICEQSHFSHIKFYRNFDVPLGSFLRQNILNQRLQCDTCCEPPEAHFYYYAHHNKQLAIQVRRLPKDNNLHGETEGKLWMWSRCGKCKSCNRSSKSTKRVLLSNDARGLSFGKFLELSFSNHYLFATPSSCGHSFQRDFLYFFGLGPMVAVFKFSPVAAYSVSLPPQTLEFGNSIEGELLKEEIKDVYEKGLLMFREVKNSLNDFRSLFGGLGVNLGGSLREFYDIEEMLEEELSQFKDNIQNIVKNENPAEAVHAFLHLNCLRWDLLLESCLWDRRLYSLQSSNFLLADTSVANRVNQDQTHVSVDDCAEVEGDNVEISLENGVDEECAEPISEPEKSREVIDLQMHEIVIEGEVTVSNNQEESFSTSNATEDVMRLTSEGTRANRPSFQHHPGGENFVEDNVLSSANLHANRNISQRGESSFSLSSTPEDSIEGIWRSSEEIRLKYTKDLLRGNSPKFESIRTYGPESTINKLIVNEGSRLRIPLGIEDYIVSEYEDEFSSIIACALGLLKDLPIATDDLWEDTNTGKGMEPKTFESSLNLRPISSLTSSLWPSVASSDSHGAQFSHRISAEESHFSSFDGLNLLDFLVSLGALHPEVSMGVGKPPGKNKYSVVCLYAGRFRYLRNQCCPSELDYIASLCRCRNWDAKGGKSKSLFAKTLDDRFIIKEIKRAEYDSFMKFAPDYFQHMNQCFEQGNQTCLAKILGIYQVTRQTKSGKETKHDLMVMENLTFGRHTTRQYDLKGALYARFTLAKDGSGDVLLDQNFVNDMNDSPLYMSMKQKRKMQRALWNDTSFLNSINVMDYSLLVGVDTQKHEIVCGIIDYLRQYTWDKQLENWVKSSLVPKNQLPTVISPKEYKNRLRKFITTHFLTVPDNWCSPRSSNPCKLCGTGNDDNGSSYSKRLERDEDSSNSMSQEQR